MHGKYDGNIQAPSSSRFSRCRPTDYQVHVRKISLYADDDEVNGLKCKQKNPQKTLCIFVAPTVMAQEDKCAFFI